jgi:Xaa-Pro aminopeptidase
LNDFQSRLDKVRELIAEHNLEALVIRKNPNLAWFIGGRVHVPLILDLACFDIVVYKDKVIAVTNKIEAPRLIAEEFPAGIEVEAIDWWQGRDALLPTGDKIGADQLGNLRIDLGSEIEKLRQSLSESEVFKFQEVCKDSAVALGNAIKLTQVNDREIDVTARIANALWQSNLELVFIGVAGESRVRNFRHPLPTDAKIGNRVVASICARRKGMIASVTRIASFEENFDSYRNILLVEAALFDATKVGARFSEPIHAAIKAYPEFGFEELEWQKHHQGGPTGFAARDWPANQNSQQLIRSNQPIAWNPTGNGWKAEDTILAKESGVEILSVDPNWPALVVAGRNRPAVLRLSK